MIANIIFFVFLALLAFTCIVYSIDSKIKRKVKKYPFVSFMIPTWNDGKTIKKTIKSVYSVYPKKRFELFIINDCSTDNTLEILKKIKKKYKFNLINNKKNLGKAKGLNNAFSKTKGEIIFVVDADMILNKKAVEDVIARFQKKRVGAVSCRYKPLQNTFMSDMQEY